MSDKLVAYFSASGNTEKLAKTLAETAGTDLFAIEPVEPYSPADLDYMNKSSRSSIEMNDKSFRPELKENIDTSGYDTIFVGFPIWWYEAPRIIQTFLESQNLNGKTVVPFATSGSSGISGAEEAMKQAASPGAVFKPGKRLSPDASYTTVSSWIEELDV